MVERIAPRTPHSPDSDFARELRTPFGRLSLRMIGSEKPKLRKPIYGEDVMVVSDMDAGRGHHDLGGVVADAAKNSALAAEMKIIRAAPINPDLHPVLGQPNFGKWYSRTPAWILGFEYSVLPRLFSMKWLRESVRGMMTQRTTRKLTEHNEKISFDPHPLVAAMNLITRIDGMRPVDWQQIYQKTDHSAIKADVILGAHAIAPDADTAARDVAFGQHPQMVHVVPGLGAGPEFRPRDRAEARRALDDKLSQELGIKNALGTTEPLIVADGAATLPRFLKWMPRWAPDEKVKLLMVCGNSQTSRWPFGLFPTLYDKAQRLKASDTLHKNIDFVVLGRREDMHLLIQAEHIFAAKAGGSTLGRLEHTQRAPLVYATLGTKFFPGQEDDNVANGLKDGVIIKKPLAILNQVRKAIREVDAASAKMAARHRDPAAVERETIRIITAIKNQEPGYTTPPEIQAKLDALELESFARRVRRSGGEVIDWYMPAAAKPQ